MNVTKRRRLNSREDESTCVSPVSSPSKRKQQRSRPLQSPCKAKHIPNLCSLSGKSPKQHNLQQNECHAKGNILGSPSRAVRQSPGKCDSPSRLTRMTVMSPTKSVGVSKTHRFGSPSKTTPSRSHKRAILHELDADTNLSVPNPDEDDYDGCSLSEVSRTLADTKVEPLLSPMPDTPTGTPCSKARAKQLPAVAPYSPAHFIRCHTGGHLEYNTVDPEDDETQIWRCAYEPDPRHPGEYTGIVATSGGTTICLIDCKSGKLMKRYVHDCGGFFVVSWTTLTMSTDEREWKTNILAAGGISGEVLLFHPDMLVCYHKFKVAQSRSCSINILMFHPIKPTVVFCACSDGCTYMWDIGTPSGADYATESVFLAVFDSQCKEMLSLVYYEPQCCLITGTGNGCFVWTLNKKHNPPSKYITTKKEVVLTNSSKKMVDSICMVNTDIIATKTVEQGYISLWSVRETLDKKGTNKLRPNILANLHWSATNAIYLSMDSRRGLLCCGDADGCIWMYNISNIIKDDYLSRYNTTLYTQSTKLEWPECNTHGKRAEEAKMVDLENTAETPILNTVCLSPDNKYITVGTQNNLVCIWSVGKGDKH